MTTPELSYPGVYVQEIPSGSRSITGVATAITAFLGRTRKGPVDEPVTISSFGDFERTFGGLWRKSGLGYAVRDYFLNGGGNAVVVRLGGGAATAKVTVGGVNFEASEPGTWAEGLTVQLSRGSDPALTGPLLKEAHDEHHAATEALHEADTAAQDASDAADAAEAAADKSPSTKKKKDDAAAARQTADEVAATASEARAAAAAAAAGVEAASVKHASADAFGEIAAQQGVEPKDLWQLDVLDRGTAPPPLQILESFPNVTFVDGPRRLDLVLRTSRLIRLAPWRGPLTAPDTPTPHPGATTTSSSEPAATASSDDPTTTPASSSSSADGATVDSGPAAGAASAGTGAVEMMVKGLKGGSDGQDLKESDYTNTEFEGKKKGLYALEKTDLFTLLCLPPPTPSANLPDSVWASALAYCERRGAFLLVDPPVESNVTNIGSWLAARGLGGVASRNAALYFPRVRYPDPLRDGASGTFVPCGAVAGVMASTDASRGVWKAPAGLEAGITGVGGLALNLNDADHGLLPKPVNALRSFPSVGPVVWGARTLRGADIFADDYKYVPVRRLALFVEESLRRGTQWVVFEPNDEPLWSQVRAALTAFMQDLFRQGAFQGRTPREAYFVQCGADTTTPYDVARGVVNIRVGFAPLKPAEFVIVSIQQMTATAAT